MNLRGLSLALLGPNGEGTNIGALFFAIWCTGQGFAVRNHRPYMHLSRISNRPNDSCGLISTFSRGV